MLNQNTIAIIKSTVPVLEQHGETLTKHFYKRMFANNPEVAPFFNPANQAEGSQQKALAGAILAYAANIDNLDALGGAVELIAHKHASLMITKDQYPIVGANLLGAIKEVLGDGATDEVIGAWGEAYGLLADILVGKEQQIYAANADKPGGWRGFRRFVVRRIQPESSIISSFYLEPADGGPLPTYLPGQYLTIRMPTPDHSTTMRNYSLSGQPGLSHFRISVKNERSSSPSSPDGYVSHQLHTAIKVGAELEVGPPCGEFTFDVASSSMRPQVFIAGGIGITPLLCMAEAALRHTPDRKIVLIHANTDEPSQAFKAHIEQLAATYGDLAVHFRYSESLPAAPSAHCSAGLVDEDFLVEAVPNLDGDFYFCGPPPFMTAINTILLENRVPLEQIRFEFFGPNQGLTPSPDAPQPKGAAS